MHNVPRRLPPSGILLVVCHRSGTFSFKEWRSQSILEGHAQCLYTQYKTKEIHTVYVRSTLHTVSFWGQPSLVESSCPIPLPLLPISTSLPPIPGTAALVSCLLFHHVCSLSFVFFCYFAFLMFDSSFSTVAC